MPESIKQKNKNKQINKKKPYGRREGDTEGLVVATWVTGRNRVTAEVSHVYFYSAACPCVKESQLNRLVYASFLFHISRSEIKSTVKRLPLVLVTAVNNYRKPKHTHKKRHSESSNTNPETIYSRAGDLLVLQTINDMKLDGNRYCRMFTD